MTRVVPLKRVAGDTAVDGSDRVVREVPLTVFLNDQEFVTLVCSPAHIEELVAGFLLVEGIVGERADLTDISIKPEEGLVWVTIGRDIGRTEELFLKRCLASCCGRGRSTVYFMNDASLRPVDSGLVVTPDLIRRLDRQREERAGVFRETGGTHGAALCSVDGLVYFYEDIGRHNAVDKVLGRAFLDGVTFEDKMIFLSGRISSEMVVKAARARVPLIVSRAAATDFALQMAGNLNITVVGFIRGDRFNIYTEPQRVAWAQERM
ncbi:MAG: formate dehydrogenase accessory sulfurtransferase FdhD [Peptococcaceae bacterium]|jgi:FdhD protein|nr:formate dehydrogenase accessory sulfurtransferase FdhD [Peptococcaceae bacterium]